MRKRNAHTKADGAMHWSICSALSLSLLCLVVRTDPDACLSRKEEGRGAEPCVWTPPGSIRPPSRFFARDRIRRLRRARAAPAAPWLSNLPESAKSRIPDMMLARLQYTGRVLVRRGQPRRFAENQLLESLCFPDDRRFRQRPNPGEPAPIGGGRDIGAKRSELRHRQRVSQWRCGARRGKITARRSQRRHCSAGRTEVPSML
jgi:hypothetical protein